MHRLAVAATAVATGAAIVVVLLSVDFGKILPALWQLRPTTLALVVLCMIVNSLLAFVRFDGVLKAFGARIGWRATARAFAFGTLAGQFLLNIIGQSLTRAMILRSAGVPMGLTVVATYVERLIGLGILGVAAIVSAFALFGSIGFELREGGAYFLSLGIGLAATLGIAGVRAAAAVLRREHLRPMGMTALRLVPVIIVNILVFASMFGAYLALTLDFAPGADLTKLSAAIVVVMFAAGLPISWAGWGLREFSAVYALNAVGVPSEAAVVVAITVGTVALLVTLTAGVLAWIDGSRRPLAGPAAEAAVMRTLPPADAMLFWSIGILVSCLIYFQLRVPTSAGDLTLNVADPLAITAFFFAVYLAARESFAAQYPRLILRALAALAAALLLGAFVAWLHLGLTQWALVNRLFGFLILLGYAAVPGLIVRVAGNRGRLVVADAFVASAVLICAFEVAAYLVHLYLVPLPLDFFGYQFASEGQLEGFAQNPNAFAFQLLMALCVLIAFHRPKLDRRTPPWPLLGVVALLAVVVIGRSRAGISSATIACALAFGGPPVVTWLRADRRRLAFLFGALAAAIVVGVAFHTWIYGAIVEPLNANWRANAAASDVLRWQVTAAAFQQWLHYPLFGHGLGSFLLERQHENLAELVIHNVPLWFLAEMGIVGFAAYVFFLASLTSESGAYKADIRRGLLVAVSVFLVMGLFHDIFFQRTFWFALGLLVTNPSHTDRRAAM